MHLLSKSKFAVGYQCQKLLWWTEYEPDTMELQPDRVLLDLFNQGQQVGEIARRLFPDGVLINGDHANVEQRIAATAAALESRAPAIFEATCLAENVIVAADILAATKGGYALIEVKSSTSVKDKHIPDAAVQAWVLGRAGIHIESVRVMHLNKDYRHPGPGELLVEADVSDRVEAFLPTVPGIVEELLASLSGPLPSRAIGLHCFEPMECPFHSRCWPDDPDHISNLYNVGPRKAAAFLQNGVHRISQLPSGMKLPDAAKRQIRALREGRLVVEPGLEEALEAFGSPLGYLDFETVSRAVPVWDGLAPWQHATAQFSYHEEQPDGSYTHVGWLAEGPGDPRRELAEAMIAATAGARRIVTYSAFEKTRIRELQALVPDLADPLEELQGKLVDLLPVVRNHIYHPDFRGSFSLKYVLTPLVPDLSYSDLVIVEGMLASVEIARLLFVAHRIPEAERDQLRKDLLAYCERDTWATVRLMARLRELAATV